MVKNFGGNKSKKMGRKFVKEQADHGVGLKTRLSEDPCEVYAAVAKEYGNGRVLVKCVDGEERIMIIRKKFKGRGKRDNIIRVGTWVLVGLRSYEARRADAKEVCDLLEVYGQHDVEFLKTNVQASWFVIGAREDDFVPDDNFGFEEENEVVEDLPSDDEEQEEELDLDDL